MICSGPLSNKESPILWIAENGEFFPESPEGSWLRLSRYRDWRHTWSKNRLFQGYFLNILSFTIPHLFGASQVRIDIIGLLDLILTAEFKVLGKDGIRTLSGYCVLIHLGMCGRSLMMSPQISFISPDRMNNGVAIDRNFGLLVDDRPEQNGYSKGMFQIGNTERMRSDDWREGVSH